MADIPVTATGLAGIGAQGSDLLSKATTTVQNRVTSAVGSAAGQVQGMASQAQSTVANAANLASNLGGAATGVAGQAASALGAASSDLSSSTGGLVQGKNPDNIVSALQSLDDWNYNALNSAQQPTYHIALFMTDDVPYTLAKYSSYQALVDYVSNQKSNTVICESGITAGLNIVSLTMDSVPAPNPATRSMNSLKFKLTIQEPVGVSFMDMLADTAKELRIKNYAKAPFFLSVRFMGYDDGQINQNLCSDFPNGGYWIYQCVLIDIQAEVTSAGSTYVLSLVAADNLVQEDEHLRLPDHIAPSGTTVKEMVEDLMTKLNRDIEFMYGYPLKTYKVLLTPFSIGNKNYDPNDGSLFKLTPSEEHLNDKRAVTMENTGGKFKAHFAHGTKISDAIEQIFANCEVVQQLAKDVMKQGQLEMDEKRARQACLPRIATVTEHGDYDIATDTYELNFTFIVKPYVSQLPILSQTQIKYTRDPEVQSQNVINLRKQGYLCKRYDYIFTGLNTEVITFDIKHNAKWAAILPRNNGDNNSNEAHAPQDIKRQILEAQSKLKEIRDREAASVQAQSDLAQLKSDPAKVTTNADKIKEAEAKLPSIQQSNRDVDQRQALMDQLGNLRGQLQSDLKKYDPIAANRAQTRYSEELLDDPEQNTYSRYDPMPLSVAQSTSDSRFYASGSLPDYYHRDRALFGAIMDQLYEQTGAALQNVTMEIRGDPYWLGASNLNRMWADVYYAREIIDMQAHIKTDSPEARVMPPNGDVKFLFTYKYPRGVGDNGAPVIKYNDFFTGVYVVKNIQHKFEGGQFTQTVTAWREPTIEAFRAFGLRSEQAWDEANKQKNEQTQLQNVGRRDE